MRQRQVTGNVGMYFVAYQLSRRGWNVMPTSRNARGIDLLAYDTNGRTFLGIQIKTLSKPVAVPLGTKPLDDLLGDWWIVVDLSGGPQCFVMRSDEVRKAAVRDKGDKGAYWLPRTGYDKPEHILKEVEFGDRRNPRDLLTPL